jgi:glutamate 5-kinase
MHTYEQLFFGRKLVGQLLLSSDDFVSPVRYRNLCNTLNESLRLGVVPIVNENDSVSVRELEGAFGDNDELSALLARAVNADWLILLTDVDGFYRRNGSGPELLKTVGRITAEMEAECNGVSRLGRGGMRSKLRAARIATQAGVSVVIANFNQPEVISLALRRRTGTYFRPQQPGA